MFLSLCQYPNLDDSGFGVEPEVRQVDSSSSILLSQDCFGYLRFFCISIQIVKLLFLVFKETSIRFFIVAALIYIASGVGRLPFLHTSVSFAWHGCLLGNFSLVSGL